MVTVDEFREFKDALDLRMKHAVRDAQRQVKIALEADSNEMKRMLCELLAQGDKISQIHARTGLARTTIYRYRDEYLALRGVESVENLAPAGVISGDWFESRFGFGGWFILRNDVDAIYWDPEDNIFLEVEEYDNVHAYPGKKVGRPEWATDAVMTRYTNGLFDPIRGNSPLDKYLNEEPEESEGFDFDLGEE